VWKKRIEKVAVEQLKSGDGAASGSGKYRDREQARGRDASSSDDDVDDPEDIRQRHFLSEIEKVRKRRSDREAEEEEMERLREEESRLRESEMYADWQQKEEDFHLEQARVRSKIRLVEGRGKPVDMLAKNIIMLQEFERGESDDEDDDDDDDEAARGADDGEPRKKRSKKGNADFGKSGVKYSSGRELWDVSALEVELREPHAIFNGLTSEELSELRRDVRTYLDLEGEDGPFRPYWSALTVLAEHHLRITKASEGESDAAGTSASGRMHAHVEGEIAATLEGKGASELEQMRDEVSARLARHDPADDAEYWEGVMQQIEVARARAVLREFHREMLRKQLNCLEARKSTEATRRIAAHHAGGGTAAAEAPVREVDNRPAWMTRTDAGDDDDDRPAIDGVGDEDAEAIAKAKAAQDGSAAAETMFKNEQDKGLGDLEELLGITDEVATTPVSSYAWADKYRPRKPRYFNRVKTG
jgi:hypothetical protein